MSENLISVAHLEQTPPKEKEIFLIILFPSEEKIAFKNMQILSEKVRAKIILDKKIEKEDGTFLEEIVFKIIVILEK